MIIPRNHRLLNRRGVTLLELIIALSILSIVMLTLGSINLFGLRTFARSRDRSEHQFEVRMPAEFIARKLRYADSVEILSAVPVSMPEGAHEIFLDSGQLIFREYGSASVILGTHGVSDYSLVMAKKSGTTNVVQYTIGKVGTAQFDLLTDVIILNLGSAGITGPTQGIGVRYYTNSADSVTPVSITSLVNPPPQFVAVDTIVALPLRITANMSDGTTRQVSARWTPSSINTSVPGFYSSSGRVVGYSGTVSLSVFAGSYEIQSIEDIHIVMNLGQSFTMPTTVVATISYGTDTFTQHIGVVWDEVIIPSTVDTYTAIGTVDGWEYPILLTVVVQGATIVSVSNITSTVLQGTTFALPSVVPATYSDKSINNVPVTWSPSTLSTANPGTFSSHGTITGFTNTLLFTLNVQSNKLNIPEVAIVRQSNAGGQQGRVFVRGTPGATAVFRRANGTIITTHVIPSTGEATFNVDTRNLHNVILRKTGWQDSEPRVI